MRIPASLGSLPVRRLPALFSVALLAVAAALGAGCGEGGVASGASVSVYAAPPLCKGARGVLGQAGGQAEDLEVRVVCLPPVAAKGVGGLAAAGANARRATEDSTSVAYLEVPGSAAKFGQSIVEAADIAWVKTSSGATAMRRVLEALEERGSSSPRSAVLDQVG
jgi:hypothetical protein